MSSPVEALARVDLRARLLHLDASLLILDKPPGLPVHAGPRASDTVERRLDDLRFGLRHPPGLAHRLDTDTSGCLVLGRHGKTMSRLGRLFASGAVAKTYWAVVLGQPAEDEGSIDLPLSKRTDPHGWRMVVDPAGQRALTDYRVLGRAAGNGLTWLELKPRTGRTHQLRVHCAAIGIPILGDPFYARPTPGAFLHLLSRRIEVPYHADRAPVTATAPPPPHMHAALTACGWQADTDGAVWLPPPPGDPEPAGIGRRLPARRRT